MSSLAVKYRPKRFAEVCAQDAVKKILCRQIETKQYTNCYLFTGCSGTGKTTIARIFAREINNGVGVPIEIDAASNSGVDNVRSIIMDAKTRALDAEYKIFIIDEAHALSSAAWQAFLKCIEEPPKYTIFIFCTTDPQKIPQTILNRVMKFTFSRIEPSHIKQRLEFICMSEGYTNYDETIEYISKICNGGMRDAISYLEKCAMYDTNMSIDTTLSVLGYYSYETYFELLTAILSSNEQKVVDIVNNAFNSSLDLKLFIDNFFGFCLDIHKYILFKTFSCLKIPSSFEQQVLSVSSFENAGNYYAYIEKRLLQLKTDIKSVQNPVDIITATLMSTARWES